MCCGYYIWINLYAEYGTHHHLGKIGDGIRLCKLNLTLDKLIPVSLYESCVLMLTSFTRNSEILFLEVQIFDLPKVIKLAAVLILSIFRGKYWSWPSASCFSTWSSFREFIFDGGAPNKGYFSLPYVYLFIVYFHLFVYSYSWAHVAQ